MVILVVIPIPIHIHIHEINHIIIIAMVVVMVDHTHQEMQETHPLLHQHKVLMEVQEVRHLYMQEVVAEVQLLLDKMFNQMVMVMVEQEQQL